MKIKLLLVVACMMLGMSAQAKDYKFTTVEGDLMKTRIYTLDNGLKVYLSVNPEKPRIQTYIAVRTGSKNDPAETTGLAHYLEHLMFKGTKQFGTNNAEAEAPLLAEIEQRYEVYRKLTDPEARKQAYHEIDSVSQVAAQYFIPNEYDKLMAAIGAEGTNAYTSNDVTCYTEDIPSNEIENWAKIQSDRFQNMVIRGFHTELEAVYEEYNISLSQDIRKLFEAGSKMLWPNHPYGLQTTIGTQEHLKNPSITNIKNYFNKWYRPNNVAICMAGDLDPDKTIAIIDQYFSGWKPGADVRQPVFPPLPPLTQPKDTTVIGQEAEQVWIAWRAKQANSLQADTLELMEDVLSNGRAGLFDLDLNQTMKVQRANGGTELMRDHGGFLLMGTPKQGQSLDEVKTLMMAEIDKLKKGDFPDNLLPSIINNMKRSHYQLLESNQGRADMFVDAFINEVDWKQEVGKIDRISKITKQEIVDFAKKFFNDGYITVYKRQGTDTLQKKIDKPAITPIPANRDQKSAFVQAIQDAQVEPIQPKFVDFQKDLTITKTKKGLPLYYVKNNENGLFQLSFRYEFGQSADKRYDVANQYLNYIGTDKMTATEVKQKFYELACSFSADNDEEWPGFKNEMVRFLSEDMDTQLTLNRLDGRILDVSATRVADGGILITFEDVTNEVHKAAMREQSSKIMTRKNALRSRFISDLADNFKAPLDELYELSKKVPGAHVFAEKARDVGDMFTDLMSLAMAEAGSSSLDLRLVDLSEMMEDVLQNARQKAVLKSVEVESDFAKGIFVEADEERFRQMLSFAFSAMINLTYRGGVLGVSLKKQNKNDIAVVRINFNPHIVLHDMEAPGTVFFGAGSSLMLALVGMHGGQITFEKSGKFVSASLIFPFEN